MRARAQAQLKGNSTGAWIDATQALRVLFDLAANADTASDALALLHELQVHQVELDLQTEEMSQSLLQLESMVARQRQLFDASPCAQLLIDTQGRLVDMNETASHDLGLDAKACKRLMGQRMDACLTAESVLQLQSQVKAMQQADRMSSFFLILKIQGNNAYQVCASLRPHPEGNGHVLAWLPWPAC
ncbi:PAS domain-containing protein [Limnohabitans sp. DM1]|uniref:PAS domain-containing protein n=1 Tax=Limnohabitans sp. DM1 TaxID=1597955 RepID=UPI0018929CE6|nr:PAS domain-containing protein [Limnohabitans sp. DM1]